MPHLQSSKTDVTASWHQPDLSGQLPGITLALAGCESRLLLRWKMSGREMTPVPFKQ